MNRRIAAQDAAGFTRRAARLLTGASLAGIMALAAHPALAQDAGTATSIVADTSDAKNAGTVIGGRGESITIGGGQVAGDNLFHSFTNFDLAAGETARWVAPGSGTIANIINRVTGGATSHIDGTIDTTAMPGADFYFINPNGVLFGAGATLNVPGAAYFSSATNLRFANGDVFSAKTANGSTLSMSTPASFGFVGGEQDIVVLGTGSNPYARLAAGEIPTPKLVITAPNIGIGNAGLLVGELELIAAGTVRDISISTPLANPTDGGLLIVNSEILVNHNGGGNGFSQIGGGQISMIDSNIESVANAGTQGSGIALQGVTLDLQNSALLTTTVNSGTAGSLLIGLTDSLTMDETSGIVSTTNGPGRGGDILVVGPNDLTITGGNLHTMSANSADGTQGAGDGGAISVAVVGNLTLDQTKITGFSTGSGTGGTIRIATSGDLTTTGVDASTSTLSTGAGGSLLFESGGDMKLSSTRVYVTTVSEGMGGDAGLLALTAHGGLTVDTSILTTASSGGGAAGNIRLQATDDIAFLSTIVTADSYGTGAGGIIYAKSDANLLARLSAFSNDAYATGNGGSVTLEALGALTVDQSHFLATSNSEGAGGDGGLIRLTGGTGVTISDAELTTFTKGLGVGGDVLVTSDGDIAVTRTVIRGESQNLGAGGDGGNVKIEAQGAIQVIDPLFTSNTYGQGNAGGILITAAGKLGVTGGLIYSASVSEGDGGNGGLVSLASGDSLALDSVDINTNTFGNGKGGYVSIASNADATLLNTRVSADTGLGKGAGGYVFVLTKGLLSMTTSNIFADTYGQGAGGSVLVKSEAALEVNDSKISADSLGQTADAGAGGQVGVGSGAKMTLNDARIYADTYGPGQGGDVYVESGGDMTINGGYISAESRGVAGFAGSTARQAFAVAPLAGGIDGDGGSVTIASAASMLVTNGAQLSTDTLGSGDGGLLTISAENALVMNGASQVYANTNGSGNGGVVILRAADLSLTDATVSARTNGSGSSFGIAIGVGKATIGANALVTSAGTASGDAGKVRVTDMEGETSAQNFQVVDGGSVTASATGTGKAGSIEILSQDVSLLSGGEVVTSSSNAHAAGSIVIDTHTLVVDGAGGASQIISQNDYSDRTPLGDNLGGDITINAHDVTIANGGQLNTNSVTGDAGVIALDLGRDGPGLLWLKGEDGEGGVIRTDSGTGSGGHISIDNVYAIVSNGSEISASGDVSNAFVSIDPNAVRVNSTDRANIVNVSGLVSIAPDQDVSSGTTIVEVPFIDASQVLEGRCRAVRSQGRGSRIDMEDLGPYAQSARAAPDRQAAAPAATVGKPGCL